jgi:hypothetical protein
MGAKESALDVSYTTAPRWIKKFPLKDPDHHSTFWTLAKLAFTTDTHLLCYDLLFHVCSVDVCTFSIPCEMFSDDGLCRNGNMNKIIAPPGGLLCNT